MGIKHLIILASLSLFSCGKQIKLEQVTIAQFAAFVKESGYKTDAERFGWSIVQKNVFEFTTEEGVFWKKPDLKSDALDQYPVTQVSYNDAMAYCKWGNCRLPNYDEYWELVAHDKRKIIKNDIQIHESANINLVGNVWEITTTQKQNKEIRLAGGSYLCNDTTCKGTLPDRELYVDQTTGNTNIGFAVIYY